ncbi:C40 family peptidase [Streptomyces sp. NPDC058548]|uniref:C40 family peptidase n=1 Tax=unclassified Streptomyces TaxID=2593676 RepID=UPI00364D497B
MNRRAILPSAVSLGAIALMCAAAGPSQSHPVPDTAVIELAAASVLQNQGAPASLPQAAARDLERGWALRQAEKRAQAPERNSRTARAPRRNPAPRPVDPRPPVRRVAVKPAAKPSTAAIAVRAALAQRGKPYVWGAVGPSSFDCSGLMQYAYRRAGVRLPRTTWDQINAGKRIPRSAIRPGDLVFYRNAAHVGMYIGDGRIVHAPRPGTVVRTADLHVMPVYAVVRPR